MKNIFLLLFLLVSTFAFSQKKKDVEAIKQLGGCFEVDFKYAETFSPIKDYEFHDRYTASAVELSLPIEVSKDKYVIQHLLVVNDTMIIKHWREDWVYENRDVLQFEGDSKWSKTTVNAKAAKGTWTQKVYGTTDEPRYEGFATWTHADGVSQWYDVAASPLPRREYTKRKDYNIMARGNRISIHKDGYTHEQDNDKIKREGKSRTLIASEKGYNVYTKADAKKCRVAEEWWDKNQAFWKDVNRAWETVLASKSSIFELKSFVRTKMLYVTLGNLEKEGLSSEENYAQAVKVLDKFLQNTTTEELVGQLKEGRNCFVRLELMVRSNVLAGVA
jgi:hypothetical protein